MGMKRQNADLYSKGATVIYGFQLLAAARSKITGRASVKVGKVALLSLVLFRVQEKISEQAFNLSLVGCALKRNCSPVRVTSQR